jgi:hypothetical protein
MGDIFGRLVYGCRQLARARLVLKYCSFAVFGG